MMEEKHSFQLSADELEYLNQVVSRDDFLANLLKTQELVPRCGVTIRLSHAEAEQLRDYLTTHLAEVGFDKNYSPNEQGQMLEKLMDRFNFC